MFDKRLTLFFLLLLKHCFISSSQQNTVLSTGKFAGQSTTYVSDGISYDAGLAVDGDTSSDFSSGSCSRTVASTGHAYWYVDLGDTYSIDYVNVFSATQFAATLTGIEVRVTSDVSSILTSTNICGSIPSSTSGHHFVYCNPSLIGRYVSLYNSNINEIIVCEVQVYGVPVIPVVICPDDIIISTQLSAMQTVTWDPPTVTDDVDTDLVANCTPSSGSSFAVGTTNIRCTATDSNTNTGDCTFNVVLEDDGNPNLKCPGETTVDTNTDKATVTWNDPSVSDNVDTGLSATCSPPSGSLFNVGSTNVTCSAMDTAGNKGSCGFNVTINDVRSPTVTCPNNIEIRTNIDQATVTWDDPSVSDNVDTGLSATCSPPSGSSFNIGSTDVTCTAADNAGNTGSCGFTVFVIIGLTILRKTSKRMTPQR